MAWVMDGATKMTAVYLVILAKQNLLLTANNKLIYEIQISRGMSSIARVCEL